MLLTEKDIQLLLSEKCEGINLWNVGRVDLPNSDCNTCRYREPLDGGYCMFLREHPGTKCALYLGTKNE
jgi:hypothetical protein